jgi:hypothetical protein
LITSKDLAALVIRRVIFHDIPQKFRGSAAEVTTSEIESEIDSTRRGHLKARLIRVLGSKSSYGIAFSHDSASPVPDQVRSYTATAPEAREFVMMSQKLAAYLFEQHTAAVSAGLLCVLDIVVDGAPGVILVKLEREEGARLELTDHEGKRTFDMSVLDNLVLTDGTRLFKTAMFLRTGKGADDFDSAACDAQLGGASSEDMAKFWLRFVGCKFTIEPKIATQRFFEATLKFINDIVPDPIQKNDIYEHLQSQLKAPKNMLSPKSFAENYLPKDFQKSFREHLQVWGVPLTSFSKDLSDIQSRLRRREFHTEHGITVVVPEQSSDVVEITSQRIVVNDSLRKVDRR